jgi:hypothetical protein
VGLDQIGIDEENRKEILTYLADRVRFAAQKSLDLWKDPTGGETASVRQLASLD